MSESLPSFGEEQPEAESWTARLEPPVVAQEVETGLLPVVVLAGACAALLGGLVWAAVVITTHIDFGFLAWFVGAATGMAIVRVAGGPVSVPTRLLAGVFAAGGIIVGKYVIFVHEVRHALGALLAARGLPVGYLDSRQMSIFMHNLGSIVRPIYALWVGLAFFAAVRTAGGKAAFGRRR